jgi:transposase
MPAAVALRPDWDAKRVWAAAREAKDADQAHRLLAIAAAYEGPDRTTAAKIGAMDPQRLRDWVRRFNAAGVEGLIDRKPAGAARRLTPEQEAELAALIEAGPEFARAGVVRWRCVDLRQLILTRRNIASHERTIGKLVRRLGFRHISARPRHLGQDPAQIEEFKKLYRACRCDHGNACPKDAGRSVVSGRNAARPEKPAHPALGAARYQATGARRLMYQIGLSVWCDLSQTRHQGGEGHAEHQYAGDAASP